MSYSNPKLIEVAQRNPKYAYEAYEFVFQGLQYAQKMLGREPPPGRALEADADAKDGDAKDADAKDADAKHDVTPAQWLDGIRRLALREFGLMARTVFRLWGIQRTDDFGDVIFTLIDAGLVSKNDDDRREDFCGVFDLDEALVHGFRIPLDEAR